MGCDYNCTLNEEDSCKPRRRRNGGSLEDTSTSGLSELMLNDIWKRLNPNKRHYTWTQIDNLNETRIISRLDRFLVTDTFMGYVDRRYI